MATVFKNCHLRAIGYKSDPPLVQFTTNCWNSKCPKPGNAVDYLNIITQIMNCTWEPIHVDVNSEDTFDWIQNGSADITVLPLRQTSNRMKKAYFTTPVSYMYYGYLVREIPQLQVEDYILSSFDPEVLLLLIACGILVGFLIFLFSRIMHSGKDNVFDWIFISSRGLIGQFYCTLNSPISAHILIGFWSFFCLIVIHNFQAKLKSFLTLSHSKGTIFTTMDGMIDAILYEGWTLVLQERGFSPFNYCTRSQCARLKTIPKERFLHVEANDDALMDAVALPKHVGFIGYTFDIVKYPITYTDVKRRVIFVRDAEAVPEFLAYAVTKNIPKLRSAFNEAITMSFPAFEAARARYTGEYAPYTSTNSDSIRGEITVLKTQHLVVLYKVSGEIILGAILFLSAEFLYFRYGERVIFQLRHSVPCRFRRVLHIRPSSHTKGADFRRPNIIILPARSMSERTVSTTLT